MKKRTWYLVWHHDSPLVESEPEFVLNQDMMPLFVPWKPEMDPSWALAVPELLEPDEDEDDVAADADDDEELEACCCCLLDDEPEVGVSCLLELEDEGVTTAFAFEDEEELLVLALQ